MKSKGIFFIIIYQKSNLVGRDINFSAKVCKTNWWKRKEQMKKRKQKSIHRNESKSKREGRKKEVREKKTHAK